ncbi:hypothetical protein JCM10212_004129 [Sporobolomyces blumeae]
MSRRASPPPPDSSYLRTIPSTFAQPPPPASTNGHYTTAPSYGASQEGHPSDLYARPPVPSDIASSNFEWSEDAASTIAPDDSVSQLDRRFTGRRNLFGPRPMDGGGPGDVPAVPEVPEEYAMQEVLHHDYVPPEYLEDDHSTVIATSRDRQLAGGNAAVGGTDGRSEARTGAMRAVNPSSVGPLARARGEDSSNSAVPYTSRQYDDEEDHEDAAPLVAAPGGSRRAGPDSASTPSAVHPYSRPKGYASVDNADRDDFDDEYPERKGDAEANPYYSRGRDVVGEGDDGRVGTGRSPSTLVGTLMSKLRGGQGSRQTRRQDSTFYTPHELAFEPPSSSSLDVASQHPKDGSSSYPPGHLSKIPSLDVASRHDRYGSASSDPNAYVDGAEIRPAPLWKRWVWDTTDPRRRVWEHKKGLGIQRWPVASWGLAIVMTIVLVIELVRMAHYTGSPIQTKPSFNVMIGPSGAVLINVGARFAGCQKFVENVTDIQWTCLADSNKATLSSSDPTCTMSDICGFGGFKITDGAGGPNQSFRFFVPIFLHAGVVHLLLNMVAQCFSSAQIERMMGTPKFLVLYLASGIFGFVLGSNFALVGQPSVGASGAIFGTHAALLFDLLAHWKIEFQPKRKLFWLVVEIVIGFGLGWVPGIDNFAHLGGFAMGLVSSLLLFPIVHSPSRAHRYAFYALRLVALPLAIVMFVVLVKNFYTSDPAENCSWCRYLSCWPTASNNRCKGTGLSTVTASSSTIASVLTILVTNLVVPFLA